MTLVGRLDYESEQSYRLSIQVRDLGENSLARFVTIDISIIDENDNSPQAFLTFVQPLINDSIISIHENTPIGQILAYVSISDQDSGLNGEMSYKIDQGNNFIGIRTIDKKSFLLIIENLIDREKLLNRNEKDKFILIIYDYGKPSKQLRLEYQINIIDENDSPPIFNQSYNCNIKINYSQNQTLDLYNNQPLFQVQATDLDEGDNGRITYSIISSYENLFDINNQGEVFNTEILNQSLDYYIRIMAIDHGKPKQLNSTQDCSIKIIKKEILINNENISLINEKKNFIFSFSLFNDYSYIIIGLFIFFIFIIIIILTICITFCLHSVFFNRRKKICKTKKLTNCSRQFNYYDTLHRKSPFIHDESACSRSSKLDDNDDITSEERERLVSLNQSDQTSCESSDSMNKQIRIINKVKIFVRFVLIEI